MSEEEETEQIYESTGRKPFFNMAEASLKRVDFALLQLGVLSLSLQFPDVMRQKIKIRLVKNLLEYATPLAPDLVDKNYRTEILNLGISKTMVIKNGNQRYIEVYDEELENTLDEKIIDISMKLQSKGYFMPNVEEDDEDDY